MTTPIDMVLNCPRCHTQHVDEATPEWDNPPHRSHLCLSCGHIWRPADVPTNGVHAITTKGVNDATHLNDEGARLCSEAATQVIEPQHSVTGIDLSDLPTYDPDRDHYGCMELRDKYKDGDYYKVDDVKAAPQHSVTEQGERVPGIAHLTTYADLVRLTPLQLWNRWRPEGSAPDARSAFIAARNIPFAQPLPSTAATQPEQASERSCGQCFGKGVIANIGEVCDLCNGTRRESVAEWARIDANGAFTFPLNDNAGQ